MNGNFFAELAVMLFLFEAKSHRLFTEYRKILLNKQYFFLEDNSGTDV